MPNYPECEQERLSVVNVAEEGFNCSAYAQLIAHELKLRESELAQLLRGTHLPREVLYAGSDIHMSGPALIQVINNARAMSADPTLGLRCAAHMRPSTHGPVGFLITKAPDLYSVLISLVDFANLKPPFINFSLLFDQRWLRFEIDIDPDIDPDTQRVILEAVCLALQSNIESYLGGPFVQGEVEFTCAAPDYHASYSDYFHSPVRFGQAKNVLLIPAEIVRRAYPTKDPQAYATAHKFCVHLLEQIPDATPDIVDRVRQLLLTHSVGALTEEDVARALFISKRTLARRLEKNGLTYRQLRESLLTELAAQYLRDDSLSVEAIAAILGYHDAANFRRAFRRWHNTTPSAYRRQLGTTA